MIVRKAEHKDLEEALILGYVMHDESRYITMEYSFTKVSNFFEFVITSPDYIFLVAEKNSRVVGGFIGYAMPQWFSDELCASDFALFIDPEHRGGRAGFMMVKQYIEWAKEKGVSSENIQLGITTGVHTEKTKTFYERLGFEECGLVMSYKGDD